jgi:hypothetical protein
MLEKQRWKAKRARHMRDDADEEKRCLPASGTPQYDHP